MLHMANTLMPAFRAWFYPHEPAGADNAEAVKAEAQRRIEATWDRLANHLGEQRPCIAGEQRTAVDFSATMLMRWSRNMPKTALAWPALARHAERMRALPSFRELYRRERLTEWV
jgi:glutathione S-transferase